MNTPVNFELAKLIKEKGYDLPTAHGYDEKGRYYRDDVTHSVNYNTVPYSDLVSSAPTIAEVVMWLYDMTMKYNGTIISFTCLKKVEI